jgi:hypothetical protein
MYTHTIYACTWTWTWRGAVIKPPGRSRGGRAVDCKDVPWSGISWNQTERARDHPIYGPDLRLERRRDHIKYGLCSGQPLEVHWELIEQSQPAISRSSKVPLRGGGGSASSFIKHAPPRRKTLQKWPMTPKPFRVLGPFWRFCIRFWETRFPDSGPDLEGMEPILQIQT